MAISDTYQYQQYKQQYLQQQIFTAPKDKLLLSLFDGATRFCTLAKKAMVERKIEETHYYILKAENIIMELMQSLKMDFDFSRNLYAIYDYLYRKLIEANLKKEEALLDEVLGFLAELRKTMGEAALMARGERKSVVGGGRLEG